MILKKFFLFRHFLRIFTKLGGEWLPAAFLKVLCKSEKYINQQEEGIALLSSKVFGKF
jgi:hypothetical protein